MSQAMTALRLGRSVHDAEFGQTWAYGGVNFIGVPATPTAAETIARGDGRKFSPDFKFRIGVDPTQAAFFSGLPKAGDKITQGAENYQVAAVEHAPGHHIAYISIR